MITSVQNENVKKWKKLHKRKQRETSGLFMIEGYHLIEEALKSDWEVADIIVQENIQVPNFCENYPVTTVSENVFKHLTQTQTPQGLAAILKMKQPLPVTGNNVLLIDAIQDPGNLGTIIRTADAAGFDAVVLGNDTVDVYNDKVIRATQGSLFHVPLSQADLSDSIIELKKDGFHVWAAALANATKYNELEVGNKTALILGNEGAGIRDDLLQLADMMVKIPIYGKAESLNVSVAAGVLMYYIKG